MTSLQVEIHPDRTAIVARAQTLILERIRRAIAERGRCFIALAGGSTPKPLYEALAKADGLSWDKLHIFWGDERYVPSDHPDSNAGMAKAAWLDLVPIPTEQVYLTPTHFEHPADAATQYQQTVQQVMGNEDWPTV